MTVFPSDHFIFYPLRENSKHLFMQRVGQLLQYAKYLQFIAELCSVCSKASGSGHQYVNSFD